MRGSGAIAVLLPISPPPEGSSCPFWTTYCPEVNRIAPKCLGVSSSATAIAKVSERYRPEPTLSGRGDMVPWRGPTVAMVHNRQPSIAWWGAP